MIRHFCRCQGWDAGAQMSRKRVHLTSQETERMKVLKSEISSTGWEYPKKVLSSWVEKDLDCSDGDQTALHINVFTSFLLSFDHPMFKLQKHRADLYSPQGSCSASYPETACSKQWQPVFCNLGRAWGQHLSGPLMSAGPLKVTCLTVDASCQLGLVRTPTRGLSVWPLGFLPAQ